MVQISL